MDALMLVGMSLVVGIENLVVAALVTASLQHASTWHAVRLTVNFSLFQSLMTASGCLGGTIASSLIGGVGCWICLGFLTLTGINVFTGSTDEQSADGPDPTRGWMIIGLSLFSAIDALVASAYLVRQGIALWKLVPLFGLSAAMMTIIGTTVGHLLSQKISRASRSVYRIASTVRYVLGRAERYMRSPHFFARRILGFLGTLSLLVKPMKKLFLKHSPMIVYHFVGARSGKNLNVGGPTLDRFEHDIKFLKKYFEFASLTELLAYNADSQNYAVPPLTITFDDGFNVIRTGALEVLRAYNVKATLFVVTSCLDNKNLMWRNKLQAIVAAKNASDCVRNYNRLTSKFGLPQISDSTEFLSSSKNWPYSIKEILADELWCSCDMPLLSEYLEENRPYLSESELVSLMQEGHQIGLHTHTHPFCSRLDSEGVRFEIVEPALYLNQRFGLSSIPFAYPFGDRLDERTEKGLYDAGVISCALGNRGFQRRGIPAFRLERCGCDEGVPFPVFGKSLARILIPMPNSRTGLIENAAALSVLLIQSF